MAGAPPLDDAADELEAGIADDVTAELEDIGATDDGAGVWLELATGVEPGFVLFDPPPPPPQALSKPVIARTSESLEREKLSGFIGGSHRYCQIYWPNTTRCHLKIKSPVPVLFRSLLFCHFGHQQNLSIKKRGTWPRLF
jgi:hypothetical protein